MSPVFSTGFRFSYWVLVFLMGLVFEWVPFFQLGPVFRSGSLFYNLGPVSLLDLGSPSGSRFSNVSCFFRSPFTSRSRLSYSVLVFQVGPLFQMGPCFQSGHTCKNVTRLKKRDPFHHLTLCPTCKGIQYAHMEKHPGRRKNKRNDQEKIKKAIASGCQPNA